jgi:hypothetical protein
MLTMTRMTDDYHIVSLPGGKCSVGSRSVGEVMHPDVGPSAEAFNLYVEQPRLRERVVATEGAFVIWDVGIGAGANILVALQNISDIPIAFCVGTCTRTELLRRIGILGG